MKQEVYDAVLEILSRKPSFNEGMMVLRKTYPTIVETVGQETLRSIQAQYYVRRMRRSHLHHYSRDNREKYYKLYKEAKSRSEEHVISRLAAKNDISPCLLARIILEEYYLNDVHHVGREKGECRSVFPPGLMTDCIRDIAKLPNPELASEIYETTVLDNFYGPAVDSIKKTCGVEYEIILKSYCLKAGLSFIDEDQMREEGYDKTPDIKLKVPIMINKRVVNWIESKASFGDPINHQQYTIDQFLPYKNRFGSGCVIYWFGFVDELAENGERGILLLDHFPKPEDIVHLKDVLEEKPEFTLDVSSQTEGERMYEGEEEDRFYNYVDPFFDSEDEFDEEQSSSQTVKGQETDSTELPVCDVIDNDARKVEEDSQSTRGSASDLDLSLSEYLEKCLSSTSLDIVTDNSDPASDSKMSDNSLKSEYEDEFGAYDYADSTKTTFVQSTFSGQEEIKAIENPTSCSQEEMEAPENQIPNQTPEMPVGVSERLPPLTSVTQPDKPEQGHSSENCSLQAEAPEQKTSLAQAQMATRTAQPKRKNKKGRKKKH